MDMIKKEYKKPQLWAIQFNGRQSILAGSGGIDIPEPDVYTPPSYRQEYEGIDRAWDTYFDR